MSNYTSGPGFDPQTIAAMWSLLVILALLAFRSQWRLQFNPRPRLRPVHASSRKLRRGVGGTVVEPTRPFPVPRDE